MKNKSILIVNIILIILTILMIFPIGFNIYLQLWGKDNLPTAVTSTYVTTMKDPQTGEDVKFIEANYYQNYNGKGKEVVELLFNGYSGIDKQAIYSRGFQLVINDKGNNDLYYYDRYNNVAFETGHEYEWGDPIIVDIDGQTYAVKLDGKYTEKKLKHEIFSIGYYWDIFWGIDRYVYEEREYTIEELLLKIKSIIKSCSNGTGDGVIPLIDLGDFLHVYSIDDNGAISNEPIGDNTLKNSYFTMETHYDRRGIVWAKQSIFKSVAYDSDFNISGLLTDVEYWQVKSQYTITQDDFVARNTTNGNYYSLSVEKLTELKSYSYLDINIDFDIDKLPDNTLGLDYYSLIGIEVNNLNIKGTKSQTFELLENSLKDTNLKSISSSDCIQIINSNSGVDL